MSEWWIGNEKIGNEGKKISGTEYFYCCLLYTSDAADE